MKMSALILCASAATAVAEPSFELIDRGDAVEIIAHDVKATSTAIRVARTRLEVEIAPTTPHIKSLTPTDKFVKVVELDGYPRGLSVKLSLERNDVRAMARFAQAIQVGNDLHLILPRVLPAEGATVKLPEPTLSAALAKKLESSPPPSLIGPMPPKRADAPKPEAPKTEPAIGSTEKPADKATEKPADKKSEPLSAVTKEESGGNRTLTYVAIGLCAIGGGMWLLKRKKAAQTPATAIEVIAQRSLGNKAKVVWLAAGTREMVVAVTPQAVRMLGSWRKNEGPGTVSLPLPPAQALEPRFASERPARAATNSDIKSSPVAGILKLREHARITGAVNQNFDRLDEEIATGDIDADALWAKEILAATTNNGARR